MSFDPRAKAASLYEEFKAFAFKGNVVDLAIGVIIGAAFAKIIESFVKNIVMPLVGLLTPNAQGFEGWTLVVGEKKIPYGVFIAEIVNFLLVALVLFIFAVKFLGWLRRAKKEEAAAPPALTKDQELLVEIRDLLGAKNAAERAK